jgi:hypothetical protein
MENTVKCRLKAVQLGEPQTYKSIAIVPLIAPADGTFQYRMGKPSLPGRGQTQTSNELQPKTIQHTTEGGNWLPKGTR